MLVFETKVIQVKEPAMHYTQSMLLSQGRSSDNVQVEKGLL